MSLDLHESFSTVLPTLVGRATARWGGALERMQACVPHCTTSIVCLTSVTLSLRIDGLVLAATTIDYDLHCAVTALGG